MSQISGLHLEQLYVTWIVCSLQVSLWYKKNALDKKNPHSSCFIFIWCLPFWYVDPQQLSKAAREI